VVGGSTGLNGLGPNNFMGMFQDAGVVTESAIQADMPAAGALTNLYVRAAGTMGAGSITYTVRENGTPTPLSCTMTGTQTACSDTTDSAHFAAGDLISIGSTRSGTPTSQRTWWTAHYGP